MFLWFLEINSAPQGENYIFQQFSTEIVVFCFTHCGLIMPYGNIGSGNGLLPDIAKPLLEPLFTFQEGLVTFIRHQSLKLEWKVLDVDISSPTCIKFNSDLPGANGLIILIQVIHLIVTSYVFLPARRSPPRYAALCAVSVRWRRLKSSAMDVQDHLISCPQRLDKHLPLRHLIGGSQESFPICPRDLTSNTH